jgi:hypothetical protein
LVFTIKFEGETCAASSRRRQSISRSSSRIYDPCAGNVIMKTAAFFPENEQSICETRQAPNDRNLRYDFKDKITEYQEFSEVRDVSPEINNFSTHYDLADGLASLSKRYPFRIRKAAQAATKKATCWTKFMPSPLDIC